MAQALWRVAGVTINGTEIPVLNGSLDPQIESFAAGSGSFYFDSFRGTRTTLPMVSIQSEALKIALDAIPLTSGLAVTELVLYLTKLASVAAASGSVHKTVTVSEGLAVIRRVGASGSANATVDIDVYCTMDGTNLPFVVAESAAALADTAIAAAWTTGKLKLSSLFETESIEYSTNWNIHNTPHSGLPYSTFAAILKGDPVIEVQSKDLDLTADIGNIGLAATNPIVTFRKLAEASPGRVADATEEHISITVPKAHVTLGQLSGAFGDVAAQGVTIHPRWDSTTIVTVDTTAAIA